MSFLSKYDYVQMQLILLRKEHHYQVVIFVAIFSDGHLRCSHFSNSNLLNIPADK